MPIDPSSEQTSETQSPEKSAAQDADRMFKFIEEKTREKEAIGLSHMHALGIAMLEERILRWPPEWGNDLVVILYGDFIVPAEPLIFQHLGIKVEAGKVDSDLVKSAMCMLTARVTVKEKSVSGLQDAAQRINTLLGISGAINWGINGSGWWSHITHGSMSGSMNSLDHDKIEKVCAHANQLLPEVSRRVRAALYWIREPSQMMMEGYRNDILRVYAGYWNAFECLVDAVCLVQPQSKISKSEKQSLIDQFVSNHGSAPRTENFTSNYQLFVDTNFIGTAIHLSVSDLTECYRTFIDPGFVAKASHALRVCFPDTAERYIIECFKAKPKEEQLYAIRNSINHGDINADNLTELIRVESKHHRLWMIVFGILGSFIPIDRPLDSEPG